MNKNFFNSESAGNAVFPKALAGIARRKLSVAMAAIERLLDLVAPRELTSQPELLSAADGSPAHAVSMQPLSGFLGAVMFPQAAGPAPIHQKHQTRQHGNAL